jgi:hypothetical protein
MDNAKRASEAATIRTGVEHKFQVHDTHGAKPSDFGVDETGMGATYDAAIRDGREPPKWLQ